MNGFLAILLKEFAHIRRDRGTIIFESMIRVSQISAIRPSIMTLVSRMRGLDPLICFENSTYGMMNRKSSLVWSSTDTEK